MATSKKYADTGENSSVAGKKTASVENNIIGVSTKGTIASKASKAKAETPKPQTTIQIQPEATAVTASPSTGYAVPGENSSANEAIIAAMHAETERKNPTYSIRSEVWEAYKALTDKERALVDLDIQMNPDKYKDPKHLIKSAKEAPLYRAAMQVAGLDAFLPDDLLGELPDPEKNGIFNAVGSNGFNPVWQEAYDSMGALKHFLNINSSGTPQEQKNAEANSLQNIAYITYQSLVNKIEQRNKEIEQREKEEIKQREKEIEQREKDEADRIRYDSFVFTDKNGEIDNGATKAFQELNLEHKRIVEKFKENVSGQDARALAVYKRYQATAKKYNMEAIADDLRAALDPPEYKAESGILWWKQEDSAIASRVSLPSDERDKYKKLYGLTDEEIDELVRMVNAEAQTAADILLEQKRTAKVVGEAISQHVAPVMQTSGGLLGGTGGVKQALEDYTTQKAQRIAEIQQSRIEAVQQLANSLATAADPGENSSAKEIMDKVRMNAMIGYVESEQRAQKALSLLTGEYEKATPADLLYSFGYGIESDIANLLGPVEDWVNFFSTYAYSFGEAVSGGFGVAPNEVSEWFENKKATAMRASWTDKWLESIDERYEPNASQMKVQNFAAGVMQMLPIISIAATTGDPNIALAAMYISVSARSQREALKKTDDSARAMTYGALTGAKEIATEKLFGAINYLGGGVFDKITSKVVGKLSASPAVQALVFKLIGWGGEGMEELVSEYAEPFLQRITKLDPDANPASKEELLEAGFIGSLTAAFIDFVGGGVYDATTIKKQELVDSVYKVMRNLDLGDFDANKFWDSNKIQRLSSYTGIYENGSADVLVDPSYYNALTNSRTELDAAESAYTNATNAFTQALQSRKRLGTNEIRTYQAEVTDAANKLEQTRQAMHAAEEKWNTAFAEATKRARIAEQENATREAAEQEQAAQQQAEQDNALLDIFANTLLTAEQKAAFVNIADNSMVVRTEDIQTAIGSGIARQQAENMQRDHGRASVALENPAVAPEEVRYLEHRLDRSRSEYVQAAKDEIMTRGAQLYGTTNVETATRLAETMPKADDTAQQPTRDGYQNVALPALAPLPQIEAEANRVLQSLPQDKAIPEKRAQASEVFSGLERAQTAQEWSEAPKDTDIPGTFVGDDGIRRSVATGSYLQYDVAAPDPGNRNQKSMSRNEITRMLSDAFETPVFFGALENAGVNTLGQYHTGTGRTGIRYPNDIQTVIHEIGHRIDFLLEIGDIPNLDSVWQSFPQDIQTKYGKDPDILRAEAKAELFKMYVNNPAEAARVSPEFVKAIESKMTREQKRAVRKASQSIRADAAADINTRIKNTIRSRTEAPGKIEQFMRNAYDPHRGFEGLQQAVFDDIAAFSRFDMKSNRKITKAGGKGRSRGEQMYIAAKYLQSSRARANYMLTEGGIVDISTGKLLANSFASCFEGLSEADLSDVDLYLNYTQGLDREANGHTVWERDADRDQIRDSVENFKRHRPEIVEAANKVHKWWETFMENVVVPSGMVSKATWVNWKTENPNYIPLRRSLYGKDPKSGTNSNNASVYTKKMRGSTADTMSATEELAVSVISSLAKAERIAFDREFYNAVLSTPDIAGFAFDITDSVPSRASDGTIPQDQWWTEPPSFEIDDDVLPIRMEDGSLRYLRIVDEGLLTYYMNTNNYADTQAEREDLMISGVKALGSFNRSRAKLLTTLSPKFGVRNVIRDFTEGITTTQEHNPIKFTAQQIAAIVRAGNLNSGKDMHVGDIVDTFELYKATGGSNGIYGSLKDSETVKELMEEVQPQRRGKLKKVAKGAEGVLSYLGETSETGGRYGEFKRVYDATGDARLAAYEAQRFTVDFRGKGTKFNTLRKTHLFLGATLNGLNKDIRAFSGQEFIKEDGTVDRAKQAWYIANKALYVALPVILSALLIKAFQNDDEDLIPEYMENGNYLIPVGEGHYLSFPKPQGFSNAVASELGEIIGELFTGDDIDLLESLATIAEAANPIGSVDAANPFGSSFILAPIIQAASNRSWTGEQIESEYDQEFSEQFRDSNTTALSKRLGELTGFSPKRIEYVLEQWGGNAWDVYDMIDNGERITFENLPEEIWEDMKGIFVKNIYKSTDAFSNFYTAKDTLQTILNDIDSRGFSAEYKNGLTPEETEEANAEAGLLSEHMWEASSEMRKLRDEIAGLEEQGASQNLITSRQKDLAGIALEALLRYTQYEIRYMK